MKKIISFSLWGSNPTYTNGAIWNAEHCQEFYPGWTCRFYYDTTVPKEIVETLTDYGSEMWSMGTTTDVLGAHWRFHVMFDDTNVERFIVRDTDSRFTKREVDMVSEWEKSGKPFHIIRDNKYHTTSILAGMWGAVPGCIPDMDKMLSYWFTQLKPMHNNPRGLFHGYDQEFLDKFVWPKIKDNHIAHVLAGEPGLKYTGEEIEVPAPIDGHYVGMVC